MSDNYLGIYTEKIKELTYVINGTLKWRKQSLRATTFAIAKLN